MTYMFQTDGSLRHAPADPSPNSRPSFPLPAEERGDILQPRPSISSLAKAMTQSLACRPSAKTTIVGA